MVCCCQLAGTKACHVCPQYLKYFNPPDKRKPYPSIPMKLRLIGDEFFDVVDDYPPIQDGTDDSWKFLQETDNRTDYYPLLQMNKTDDF